MVDERLLRLLSALANPDTRSAAAAETAAYVGADACLVFVEDDDVDALLPAPGFAQTLPGGETWRRFLAASRAPGLHRGTVAYPSATHVVPAVAYSCGGMAVVLVGGRRASECIETLEAVGPLLAGTLRGEQAVSAARGELRVAQEQVHRAETLALALDTARSDLERTLRELETVSAAAEAALGRAEEAARAKDEFLAMLGHELRNPLSPIVTALQLMRLKNDSSRERDVIERQVAALSRLVDDLLDVSRITRGKIELQTAPTELSDVVARAVEMSSPELEARQQMLAVDVPRGLLVVADRTRLAQVVANLLTNAAKYSDPGSHVTVTAGRDAEHVLLRVRDEGIGIEPAMIDRIFEHFVQRRQTVDRAQGGLGLGLAIVRSLVTLHGGRVWAHSEGLGKGSEFVVELPLAIGASVPDGTREPAIGALAARHRTERVLVVDDNEDAAAMLSGALDTLGYQVRSAPDGPTALRIADDFQPAIALVDIGLPVMDGYELAQHLRTRWPALRLTAVTGYGQEADRRRAAAAGFDAHLVKPITLEQLEAVFQAFSEAASPARVPE